MGGGIVQGGGVMASGERGSSSGNNRLRGVV